MGDYKEKKNRKIGLIVAGAVHVVLFIIFLFVIAWKEPDPPIPEYGIELNLGFSNVGSGQVQTKENNQNTLTILYIFDL